VLAAVQLDGRTDVARLRLSPGEGFSLGLLRGVLPVKTVLSFGVDASRLGLRFALRPYEVVEHAGVRYLLADELAVIHQERMAGGKQRATELWRGVQEVFAM
jgi:hypothetical protein